MQRRSARSITMPTDLLHSCKTYFMVSCVRQLFSQIEFQAVTRGYFSQLSPVIWRVILAQHRITIPVCLVRLAVASSASQPGPSDGIVSCGYQEFSVSFKIRVAKNTSSPLIATI